MRSFALALRIAASACVREMDCSPSPRLGRKVDQGSAVTSSEMELRLILSTLFSSIVLGALWERRLPIKRLTRKKKARTEKTMLAVRPPTKVAKTVFQKPRGLRLGWSGSSMRVWS